jgi:hypothetical protein
MELIHYNCRVIEEIWLIACYIFEGLAANTVVIDECDLAFDSFRDLLADGILDGGC